MAVGADEVSMIFGGRPDRTFVVRVLVHLTSPTLGTFRRRHSTGSVDSTVGADVSRDREWSRLVGAAYSARRSVPAT